MEKYKFTLIGFILSVFLWLLTATLEFDPFIGLAKLFKNLETFDLDRIIFPFILFTVFYHIDNIKNQRQIRIEAEKNKIYKAMLVANHHILNNFLNEMQIFKLTAEETNDFPKDVIDLYEEIIKNAKQQIEGLSHLNKIDEESINKAVLRGISINHTSVN